MFVKKLLTSDAKLAKQEHRYVSKLIDQLKVEDQDAQIKILRLDCIEILTSFMDPKSLPKNENRPHSENEEDPIASIQAKLAELNILIAAIELLDSEDEEVVTHGLKLLVALFSGGSKSMQEKMEAYFQSSSDPHFFEDIQAKLVEAERKLKLTRQQVVSQEKRSHVVGSQSFNEQDQPEFGQTRQHSSDFGNLLLFFLQNLCEGHNEVMKNYLREQINNTKSFNLIRAVADYAPEIERNFHLYKPRYFKRKFEEPVKGNQSNKIVQPPPDPRQKKEEKFVEKKLLPLSIQLFRTLNEFCSGVPENQKIVMQAKIFFPINALLEYLKKIVDDEKVTRLKISMFELLNSLIEGLFPEKPSERNWIPLVLLKQLNLNIIKETLFASYQASQRGKNVIPIQMKDDSLSKTNKESLTELSASIVIFLKILSEFEEGPIKDSKVKKLLGDSLIVPFVQKEIATIEIVNEQNELERVYFKIPEICHNLKPKTKDQLVTSVRRDSPTEKIEDFVRRSRNITYEIEHQTQVEKVKMFSWIATQSYKWRRFLQIITFAINLLMLIFYESIPPQPGYDGDSPILPDNGWLLIVFYILAGLHFLFSSLMMISYFWNW